MNKFFLPCWTFAFCFFIHQISLSQSTNTGVATYFDGLGSPYGACGVPQSLVDSDNFVALNVYNSPGVGTMWTRPITGADTIYMGEYKNGKNCGRWLKVTLAENCIGGINDGALGQPFCRNGGQWLSDLYDGASLYMVVADACGDNNGWCRDSRYHLDLHKPALQNFQENGTAMPNLYPGYWNNRKINWEYVPAPNYTGDVNIYFLQGAQNYWPCIMINHLLNGITWVEQLVNGQWVKLTMNSDMGQSYLLNNGPGPYTIRIGDASGNYVQNGREYTFTNPCSSPCGPPATPVTYTTFDPNPLAIPELQLQFSSESDEWTIQWQLPTDNSNLQYSLQYSNDGIQFYNKESQISLGNRKYQAEVSNLQVTYVRLANIDNSGHATFGRVYLLTPNHNEKLLEFAGENLFKINSLDGQQVKITLWNAEGKLIWQTETWKSRTIQIPSQSNNLYLLRASSSTNYSSLKWVSFE